MSESQTTTTTNTSKLGGGDHQQDQQQDVISSIQKRLDELELSKAEERAIQKNNDKHYKDIQSSLNSFQSKDEQLAFIFNKYKDLYNKIKKIEKDISNQDVTVKSLTKDNSNLKNELQKSINTSQRMDAMNTQLNKKMSSILDESKSLLLEEEKKRKAMVDKFSSTLQDVSSKLDGFQLKEDRQNEIIKLYEEKIKAHEDQNHNSILVVKKTEIESKILELKLKEQSEITLKQDNIIKIYKEELERIQLENIKLKEKNDCYDENIGQFHDVITKSNEKFKSFTTEMGKISAVNISLEKEKHSLMSRNDNLNRMVLEMASETALLKKKNEVLMNLSRTLTVDRTNLQLQLKEMSDKPTTNSNQSDQSESSSSTTSTDPDTVTGTSI